MRAALAVSPPSNWTMSFGSTGTIMPRASMSRTTVTKTNASAARRGPCAVTDDVRSPEVVPALAGLEDDDLRRLEAFVLGGFAEFRHRLARVPDEREAAGGAVRDRDHAPRLQQRRRLCGLLGPHRAAEPHRLLAADRQAGDVEVRERRRDVDEPVEPPRVAGD